MRSKDKTEGCSHYHGDRYQPVEPQILCRSKPCRLVCWALGQPRQSNRWGCMYASGLTQNRNKHQNRNRLLFLFPFAFPHQLDFYILSARTKKEEEKKRTTRKNPTHPAYCQSAENRMQGRRGQHRKKDRPEEKEKVPCTKAEVIRIPRCLLFHLVECVYSSPLHPGSQHKT